METILTLIFLSLIVYFIFFNISKKQILAIILVSLWVVISVYY